MRHLILHIGAPKCGSTYLQNVLLKNQRVLRRVGVNYPHLGHGHPGNVGCLMAVTRPWLESAFDGFHAVVLSHENLMSQAGTAHRIKRLCDDMSVGVTLFVVLRPFPDLVFADYSQFLKQNFDEFCQSGLAYWGMGFRQFVMWRRPKVQFKKFMDEWRAIWPQASLQLASLDQVQDRFCQIVPQATDVNWVVPRWRSNPSIPMMTCDEIGACINRGDRGRAQNLMRTGRGPSCTTLERSRRVWIENLYADQITAILAEYQLDLRGAA